MHRPLRSSHCRILFIGVEGLAVAYGVASNNMTLPIPDDCYQPFDGLLRACWQRRCGSFSFAWSTFATAISLCQLLSPPSPGDLKLRPTFAAILATLQGQATKPFLSVPRGTFKRMQSSWTPQIEVGCLRPCTGCHDGCSHTGWCMYMHAWS